MKKLKKLDYIGLIIIIILFNNRDEKLKKARVDADEAIKSYQKEQEERMEAEKEKVSLLN